LGKLTATGIKQVKPAGKAMKMADGDGLYLLVKPNGLKYWRYDYRYNDKRKTLSIGVYPDLSLADARKAHQSARQQLLDGTDPAEAKRIEKLTKHLSDAESFEAVALEWFDRHMEDKSHSHKDRTGRLLKNDLYPYLGSRPIADITPPELLAVLRRIEGRGAIDMAHRAKQTASLIFRYAVATGRAERDPSQDITGALKTKRTKHHAAIIEPKEVGRLMVAIDGFQGTAVVMAALKISPYLLQRPNEIRNMEWTEINWEESRWEIPAEKMKMREPHIVPLSKQALEILRDIERLTGRGRYVFPSARGASRPLSDNGVRTALRTIGYSNEQMTPHGFRAMARTLLDEVLRYRVDYIEAQLAHAVKDVNGRAYNRTTHIEERRHMMQAWADYLDQLKVEASSPNVLSIITGALSQ